MFDINRYNGKKFSSNPFIDKKIKALFLLFDKKAHEAKLGYRQTMSLIDEWIKVLVSHEEYELADAFHKRKIMRRNKWKKINRIFSARLFFRVWRRRINRWVRL